MLSPLPPPASTPKHQLTGITLASGWKLVEQLRPSTGSSGGTFGVGYKAVKGPAVAFVKAIDFVEALRAADPLLALTQLSTIANFEKDVLEYCSARGMSRVLKFLGHEYVSADGTNNPMSRVSCLVMEAGTEDLRRLVNAKGLDSCSWNLRVLQDVAQAVAQLHRGGIAHQDIKPSNVIAVNASEAKQTGGMKIGDLGRVIRRDAVGPFDTLSWPGDGRYSPPERWYNYVPQDWADARDASDAYMLGSLLLYLFTGTTVQTLVWNLIPHQFHPSNWTGKFDQDLLAVLIDVHSRVLGQYLLPVVEPELADGVMAVAKALTHPDPLQRGDTNARRQAGRPVGLDRIHQKLNVLALRCAAIERGRKKV